MEGERAQIMQNGTSVLDASSASPDHAVGVDPMVAEQIEIVRGPASLIYGGGNVGGIINVTDHRIPKESLDGMMGRGEAKYDGADNERSGVAVVDVGNGSFAIHADAYQRLTDDLKIPQSAAQKLINDGYAENTKNRRLLNLHKPITSMEQWPNPTSKLICAMTDGILLQRFSTQAA
jgi:iron complex outermembrane receptor protein